MTTDVRGIRNNNPLNIEAGAMWQGLDESNPTDGRFARFESPEYGIRAAVRILHTYRDEHGIDTVRDIITRWCPPEEPGNDTEAYIDTVCNLGDFAPGSYIRMDDYDRVLRLVQAMATVECGVLPDYPATTWEKGLRLGGVTRTKPPIEQRTNAGVMVNATGATALIIAAIGDLVPELSPVLTPLVDKLSAPWAIGIAVVLVVLGNSTVLYARFDDWRNGRR